MLVYRLIHFVTVAPLELPDGRSSTDGVYSGHVTKVGCSFAWIISHMCACICSLTIVYSFFFFSFCLALNPVSHLGDALPFFVGVECYGYYVVAVGVSFALSLLFLCLWFASS